jgi:hypothetical protein
VGTNLGRGNKGKMFRSKKKGLLIFGKYFEKNFFFKILIFTALLEMFLEELGIS